MKNSERVEEVSGLSALGFRRTVNVRAHWGIVHAGEAGRMPTVVMNPLYETPDDGPLDDSDVSLSYKPLKPHELYRRLDTPGVVFRHGEKGPHGDNVEHGLRLSVRLTVKKVVKKLRDL